MITKTSDREFKDEILGLVIPNWRGQHICDLVIDVPVNGPVRITYDQLVKAEARPMKVRKQFILQATEAEGL